MGVVPSYAHGSTGWGTTLLRTRQYGMGCYHLRTPVVRDGTTGYYLEYGMEYYRVLPGVRDGVPPGYLPGYGMGGTSWVPTRVLGTTWVLPHQRTTRTWVLPGCYPSRTTWVPGTTWVLPPLPYYLGVYPHPVLPASTQVVYPIPYCLPGTRVVYPHPVLPRRYPGRLPHSVVQGVRRPRRPPQDARPSLVHDVGQEEAGRVYPGPYRVKLGPLWPQLGSIRAIWAPFGGHLGSIWRPSGPPGASWDSPGASWDPPASPPIP